MIHVLLLLPLAAGTRSLVENQAIAAAGDGMKTPAKTLKCVVKTQNDWDAFVAFPVKTKTQCSPQQEFDRMDGKGPQQDFTQDVQFPLAFDVAYDPFTNECICSVKGKPRVDFWPVEKAGQASKETCLQNKFEAKDQCWRKYKKLCSLAPKFTGIDFLEWIPVRNFNPSVFIVDKTCPDCDPSGGENASSKCNDAELALYTSKLTAEQRSKLHDYLERKRAAGDMSTSDKEIDGLLTKKDHQNLRWSEFDKNGDGKLSVDELLEMYDKATREQVRSAVEQADQNGNGEIDFDEFEEFQDIMEVMLSEWRVMEAAEQGRYRLVCVNKQTEELGKCPGGLSVDDLLALFTKHGATRQQVQSAVARVDRNGNGVIDLDEFEELQDALEDMSTKWHLQEDSSGMYKLVCFNHHTGAETPGKCLGTVEEAIGRANACLN